MTKYQVILEDGRYTVEEVEVFDSYGAALKEAGKLNADLNEFDHMCRQAEHERNLNCFSEGI